MVKAGLGFITRTVFQQMQDWDLVHVPIAPLGLRWQSYMAAPNAPRRSRVLSVFFSMLQDDHAGSETGGGTL